MLMERTTVTRSSTRFLHHSKAIIKVNILQGQLQGKGGSGVSSKQEVAVARAALNGLLATPLDQVEPPWD